MPERFTRKEKMSDAFLVFGSQYFAHARYSAQYFYLPVSVTLFHHSIEMLLKGYLSKSMPSSELKKIGHNLELLWDIFKAKVVDSDLSRFDETIRLLNKVELIRYPDSMVDDGYVLNVSLGSPSFPMNLQGSDDLPHYSVNVADLDGIAEEVFKACGVATAPYFNSAPTDLKNALPASLRPND